MGAICLDWLRLDLAARPSARPAARSAVRSISPYRLAGGMRAPFLSARSPASFRGGLIVFLSSRLPSRLLISWSVSWLFFRFARRLVLLVHSLASRPSVSPCSSFFRLSRRRRSLVSRLAWRPVSRLVHHLARVSRQAARVLSFRSAARFSFCGVVSCSPSRSFLFSSHLARCVSWPWRRAAARLVPVSWRRALVPVASRCGIRFGDGGGGMNAPFSSARFLIRRWR